MPTLGEQLHEYNRKFFGYGSWESKIWFVGMEEGGADSSATSAIEKRLALWYAHKHPTLEDAPSIYGELEYSKPWFAQRPTVQPTWRQLIRVVAASKHQKPTNEEIADIQKTGWGRPNSEAAILELFALPSPRASDWHYQELAGDLFYLKSRELYMHYLYQARADHLRTRIMEHNPCAVLFYGWGKEQIYRKLWEGIVRQPFTPTGLPDLAFVEDVGVFLAVEGGFGGLVVFQGVEVFQEQQPGGLLGVVEFAGATGVFPKDVVDVFEGLFEHGVVRRMES